jgi:RNA polymerase sigma factor (sigma-70 family)
VGYDVSAAGRRAARGPSAAPTPDRRAGDVRTKLVLDHMRHARGIAWSIAFSTGQRHLGDDLADAAYEGLVKAAEKYQPGELPFKPFSSIYIKSAVYDEMLRWRIVKRRAWERGERAKEVHPDIDAIDLAPLSGDRAEWMDFKDGLRRLAERQRERVEKFGHGALRQPEEAILFLLGAGYTEGEVAEPLGVSRMRVANIARAARGRLREEMAA